MPPLLSVSLRALHSKVFFSTSASRTSFVSLYPTLRLATTIASSVWQGAVKYPRFGFHSRYINQHASRSPQMVIIFESYQEDPGVLHRERSVREGHYSLKN